MATESLVSFIQTLTIDPKHEAKLELGPGEAATISTISLSVNNNCDATHCVVLDSDWLEEEKRYDSRTTIARLRKGGVESIAMDILLTELCGPVRLVVTGIVGDKKPIGSVDVVLVHTHDKEASLQEETEEEQEEQEIQSEKMKGKTRKTRRIIRRVVKRKSARKTIPKKKI